MGRRETRFRGAGASAAALMLLLAACGGSTAQGAADTNDAGAQPPPPPGPSPDADAGAGVDATPGPDNGTPSTTYPAPHPAAPQITSMGGPVLAAPVFVPVTFDGDAMRPDIEAFLSKIGASSYWSAVTSEYGVGAGKGATPVHLSETAPTKIASTDIDAWLVDKLDGTHPEWPAPTDGTIYVVSYPPGTQIELDQWGTSCQMFGGYHGQVQLKNGTNAVYAILPRCGGAQGMSALDILTFSMSHELIEASTDPLDETNPAYMMPDADHQAWMLVPLSEVGDMCTYRLAPLLRPPDIGYAVQRTWSNAAAKAGHDPCVPAIAGEPYFNAAPVLTDDVDFAAGMDSKPTKGVKVAVGQSKTIEIDLFSDGPTTGPMTVHAMDANEINGGKPDLGLSLDRTHGVNGEKLHLTITANKAGQYGGSEFVLLTTIGKTTNFWAGWVQN
jgi:hypothetical protein